MPEEEYTKRNSIVESNIKASSYKPFVDFLKKNLEHLSDFVISHKEILQIIPHFDYDYFIKEFNKTREFRNLKLIRNPYDDKIFHITNKNIEIPSKYTHDVMKTVAENGYNTTNIKQIIEYWQRIEKEAKHDLYTFKECRNNSNIIQSGLKSQSENYSNLNMNNQSLDGTYGTHIYKERDSGRFYSVPSYDNYNEESNL